MTDFTNEDYWARSLRALGYTVEKPSLEALLEAAHSTAAYRNYHDRAKLMNQGTEAHEKEAVRLKRLSEQVRTYHRDYMKTPERQAYSAALMNRDFR